MSLFIEVFDVKKDCPVIINLEHVVEVTPLRSGGCEVSFLDGAAVNGKRLIIVKDEYSMFKQLVMHMVTPEAMNGRIAKIKESYGITTPVMPDVKAEENKSSKKKTPVDAPLEIPKL